MTDKECDRDAAQFLQDITCQNCGKGFSVRASDLRAKNRNGKFCSQACVWAFKARLSNKVLDAVSS